MVLCASCKKEKKKKEIEFTKKEEAEVDKLHE
jgi:hypothetical protein